MKYLIAFLLFLTLTAAHAEIVEVTDRQGRTISVRLLELENDELTFSRTDGRKFTVPLADLSEESRLLARQKLGSTVWERYFPNGLIGASGEEVSPLVLEGKMVILYFGASWCGPCKPVGDRLKEFRDAFGEHVEVVFISQDRSEPEQMTYMLRSGMPWPAVKWADPRANEENEVRRFIQDHQAWGIPAVVVLSRRGEVLDREARSKIQFLPEENIAQLKAFDYERALASHREREKERGNRLTAAEEAEFVNQTRSRLENRIAEFARLERETARPGPLETPVSWTQLLGTFYESRRE